MVKTKQRGLVYCHNDLKCPIAGYYVDLLISFDFSPVKQKQKAIENWNPNG